MLTLMPIRTRILLFDFDADPAYHSDAYAVPNPDPAIKMMRIWVRNTARFSSNLFVEGSVN
jgi:hypothetical protein